MSDPFATAGELSQFIGVPEPADLARMQSLLAQSSALIRRYSGQTLSPVLADIVTINPMYSLTTGQQFPQPTAYGELIFLPERPVTAIGSLLTNNVAFTAYGFNTDTGLVYRTDGLAWTRSVTITYDHGFAETTDEFAAIKNICLEAAARAYTLNERSASEAMGGTIMEAAGYAPEVFLTPGEKAQLEFGRAYVG